MHGKVYSFDYGVPGGIRSYSRNLVKAINEHESGSAIALTLCNTPRPREKLLQGRLNESDLNEVVTVSALFLRLEVQEEDLLILHDSSTMDFFRRGRFRSRIWIVLHGDYDYYIDTARRYSLWADCTLTVTENLRKRVDQILQGRVPSFHLPSIVNSPFTPNFERKKGNKAIFIGRHTRAKGAHFLVKVDEILYNKGIALEWILITSGKYDEQIRNQNLAWVRQSDRVSLLENVSNELIFSQLEASTFFILPSIAEGFPVSLIEAFSQGCVPIVFPYGLDVTNQLPREFHANIINEQTADGIAACIERIFHGSSLKEMFELSRKWFESNHTFRFKRLDQIDFNTPSKRLKSPIKFKMQQVLRKIIEARCCRSIEP